MKNQNIKKKKNKLILFTRSAADKVEPDGSRKRCGWEAPRSTNYPRRKTARQLCLEQTQRAPLVEIYGPRIHDYINHERLFLRKKEHPLLAHAKLERKQLPRKEPNEEAITALVYGSAFGREYIYSMLSFVKDIEDEEFKKTLYAYCCDLTHGALELSQQIGTQLRGNEANPPLEEALVQNDALLAIWKKLKAVREETGPGRVGIEESLLARKLYLRLFGLFHLHGKHKEDTNEAEAAPA